VHARRVHHKMRTQGLSCFVSPVHMGVVDLMSFSDFSARWGHGERLTTQEEPSF
jgi:hypothetical protein